LQIFLPAQADLASRGVGVASHCSDDLVGLTGHQSFQHLALARRQRREFLLDGAPRAVEIYRANVVTMLEAKSLSELVRMAMKAKIG
jgi:hypothetical protein